jgi:hypothetical protein
MLRCDLEPAFRGQCRSYMPTDAGKCVLTIDGQHYVGFEYATEAKGSLGQGFGFISWPAKVLKNARLMGTVQIQFADGRQQEITILVAHDSRMALFSFYLNSPSGN